MFKHETQVIKFLLQWYSVNSRNLPWRKKNTLNLPDPYFVFVSEYMLQQTTVNTVKNKFNEFILKWPSLNKFCLLYTSPSPRDATLSRMPSSA